MTGVDLPGFADPVTDAQTCFRAVLDAMARPGRIHKAGLGLTPPAPLDPATAAVLLTLADSDTNIWLDRAASPAADWLLFHAGAPIVSQPADAAFAVGLSMPDFSTFRDGSDEAPESGATLIAQIRALGSGQAFRLSGPGLQAPCLFAADGLPDDFARVWQANRTRFPRGIDLILCAGNTLAALPRTVAVEAA